MQDNETAILQQIEWIHQYVQTTGTITTNWFFFAAAVNATVAGWLIQTHRVERAVVIPILFILCDLALAAMYFPLVVLYYQGARSDIAKFTAQLQNGPDSPQMLVAFPYSYWVATSIALALICLAMAAAWCFFFFTKSGKGRLFQLVRGSGA